MHGHRFFVLNYYDRGVGEVRLPQEVVRVAAGHVLLAAPGELHDTSGIAHMGGWVVEFAGDLLGPQAAGPSLVLPRTDGTPWLAFAGRHFDKPAHAEVPAGERPAWAQRFERLERETLGAGLGSREAIRALLHLLLVDLARLLAPSDRVVRAPRSPLLSEVFGVIERRYAEPKLSLAAIARAVGRSPSHVTAVLRIETGMTVLEWLTERRMAEARRCLQETDENVAIIGERVGYLDPGYFARVFRRGHGMSARSYRREHR
jgi:AraC family transcriptional activator of pobA